MSEKTEIEVKPAVERKRKSQQRKSQGDKKPPKLKAKLTSESLAALLDRGELIIESPDFILRLKMDAFDVEDLENLQSAAEDLEYIIENLQDEADEDDDFRQRRRKFDDDEEEEDPDDEEEDPNDEEEDPNDEEDPEEDEEEF